MFIPVVAITGTAQDDQQLAYFKHGFDAVLSKPFRFDEFITAITRLLRLRADPDHRLIHLGFEMRSHDYKEIVDLSTSYGRASLAKDVMAMANWGGGTIVVGVAEPEPGKFIAQGVSHSVLNSLETSRLNRAVNAFLDPPVSITVRRVSDGNQTFVVLEVPAARGSLVLVKRQNEDAGMYLGRIYSRSVAAESAEVRTSSELRDLLDRLQPYKS
jgi:predicted HTH transcriptional regulator